MGDALQSLEEQDIDRVWIVHDGRVVGILSRASEHDDKGYVKHVAS